MLEEGPNFFSPTIIMAGYWGRELLKFIFCVSVWWSEKNYAGVFSLNFHT